MFACPCLGKEAAAHPKMLAAELCKATYVRKHDLEKRFWSIRSDRPPGVAEVCLLAGAARGLKLKRPAGGYRAQGRRTPSRKAGRKVTCSHSAATAAAIEEAVARARAEADQQKQAAVAKAAAQARKEAEEATAAKFAHTQCIICQDKIKEVAMIPCGHATTCKKCHIQNTRYSMKCMVCRGAVTEVKRVYI